MNHAPLITSPEYDALFHQKSRAMGYDSTSVWVGGYVDYQWQKLPPFLSAYGIETAGRDVLEFGSNVGASTIVFACLGAKVIGVDVSAEWIDLARLNAKRYGFLEGGTPLPTMDENSAPTERRAPVAFLHVPDTRKLPFPDGHFDVINCASVLECVPHAYLRTIQWELDRVLKPGGYLLVTGTSSRLWPLEVHSRRWGVNYLPRFIDHWTGRSRDRGVWPWDMRYGFGSGYVNLDAGNGGHVFLAAREGMSGARTRRLVAGIAGRVGIGPGLLAHSISCVLRKG